MDMQLDSTYKIVTANAAEDGALANQNYPASGSFVDTSGSDRVDILIRLGTLADALTFTVQGASAANGTPASVDTTNLVHTGAANDDNEFVAFSIPISELSSSTRYLSVLVAGVATSNDAEITFFLKQQDKPATQADLPAASRHYVPVS